MILTLLGVLVSYDMYINSSLLFLSTGGTIQTTIQISFPIPDLNTVMLVQLPLSLPFQFPLSRGASIARSLSSTVDIPRYTLYKTMEDYVGQIMRHDGHACLLRTICETNATPLHGDGVFGDLLNFLFSANHHKEEIDHKLQPYLTAQARGQVRLWNMEGFFWYILHITAIWGLL